MELGSGNISLGTANGEAPRDRSVTPLPEPPPHTRPLPASAALYGFDWLRALMSLAVVAIHMKLFPRSLTFSLHGWRDHTVTAPDLIYFHFLFLAVPAFFLMSLYLLALKIRTRGLHYFAARLEKLLYLYLFWSALSLLLQPNPVAFVHDLHGAAHFLVFVASGGYSIFYFFFSLLLLSSVTYLTRQWHTLLLCALLVLSLAALWVMPLIVIRTHSYHFLTAYWNPLNFAPCAFIALLAARYPTVAGTGNPSAASTAVVLTVAAAFAASAIGEWLWLPDKALFDLVGDPIPAYTRMSVSLGGALLLLCALHVRRPAPTWVKLLARYSLGLYCLHLFVLALLRNWLPDATSVLAHLESYLIVLFASWVGAFVLNRAFRSGLI